MQSFNHSLVVPCIEPVLISRRTTCSRALHRHRHILINASPVYSHYVRRMGGRYEASREHPRMRCVCIFVFRISYFVFRMQELSYRRLIYIIPRYSSEFCYIIFQKFKISSILSFIPNIYIRMLPLAWIDDITLHNHRPRI